VTNVRYRAGRDLEYAARNYLQVNGYIVVRAASSKGIADLVALKLGETLLVQCKTGGALGPAERYELYGSAVLVGAVPLLARWVKPSPSAAREVWFTELISSERDGQRAWTADHAFCTCPDIPELGRCEHQRQGRRSA
jgi:hypothetical protein